MYTLNYIYPSTCQKPAPTHTPPQIQFFVCKFASYLPPRSDLRGRRGEDATKLLKEKLHSKSGGGI